MQIFADNVTFYLELWKYALCVIICARFQHIAGRMCTPSNKELYRDYIKNYLKAYFHNVHVGVVNFFKDESISE